jgi:hypothetical protein
MGIAPSPLAAAAAAKAASTGGTLTLASGDGGSSGTSGAELGIETGRDSTDAPRWAPTAAAGTCTGAEMGTCSGAEMGTCFSVADAADAVDAAASAAVPVTAAFRCAGSLRRSLQRSAGGAAS